MYKFSITGMGCAACSAKIEKTISELQGVQKCSVNLLTNLMTVEGIATAEEIISAVESAGYGATLLKQKESDFEFVNAISRNLKSMIVKIIFSSLFLFVLMYFSMGHSILNFPLPSFVKSNFYNGIIQAVLAFAVICINYKIIFKGFVSLVKLSPGMDSLVALGSIASFSYSLYVLIFSVSSELYFEGSAMILTLISLGKLLETKAKGKTTNSLRELINLSPKTAVILEDGIEKTIPVENIKKDDIFVLKPGQTVPVDGLIVEGTTSVNESIISGESIPVNKKSGDEVISATSNINGYIKCKATRVGKDTTISQIINLVTESASSKAPVQKIADKVSGYFVPFVIVTAVITFAVWMLKNKGIEFSILRGISVLVISCPCSLGLATPVAIMVGNGVAAKKGILFKNSVSLEQTGKTSVVVLDKTGTITTGQPFVKEIIALENYTQNQILQIVFSLENKSRHPVALAIINKAEKEKISSLKVQDFLETPGVGVKGIIDGENYFCGRQNGESFISVLKNEVLIGKIFISDSIKDDSLNAINLIKNLGLKVIMLTGDNEQSALETGKNLQLDKIISNVKPSQKAQKVLSFKKDGLVMMVGDGINDAPALTCADIGVAIGAGSDIAIESADVVLVKNSLKDVSKAVLLSRSVLKNIHQNLFWAFFYNIIGIPLAAGCFSSLFGWNLNPMFCAFAMSVSSLLVVTNSLRLNRLKNKL